MPHIDVSQASVALGIICTIAVVAITALRQRRFELIDLGTFILAYFSGLNIPAALFLCVYVFMSDPALNSTLLKGYERYISFAGLVLLLTSLITFWKLVKTAWKKSAEKPL